MILQVLGDYEGTMMGNNIPLTKALLPTKVDSIGGFLGPLDSHDLTSPHLKAWNFSVLNSYLLHKIKCHAHI